MVVVVSGGGGGCGCGGGAGDGAGGQLGDCLLTSYVPRTLIELYGHLDTLLAPLYTCLLCLVWFGWIGFVLWILFCRYWVVGLVLGFCFVRLNLLWSAWYVGFRMFGSV